jgi:hypothetical protein
MAQIINLNRAKKAAAKSAAKLQADANAAKFGQTKAEKALRQQVQAKSAQSLDGHLRE